MISDQTTTFNFFFSFWKKITTESSANQMDRAIKLLRCPFLLNLSNDLPTFWKYGKIALCLMKNDRSIDVFIII